MVAVYDEGWSLRGLAFFVGLGVRLKCRGAKLGTGLVGLVDRVKIIMKKTIEVYTWATLASFVRDARNFKENQNSNEVLDVLAKDLYTGDLQRRDTSGYPTKPWEHILELGKSYLLPAEVNARPVMKKWLLEWSPEAEKTKILTSGQKVEQFGGKGALNLKEKRIRSSSKAAGIKISNTMLAGQFQVCALHNDIRTDEGVTPTHNETQPMSAITLKKPKRTNVLSPLINRAIKECGSDDISDVWNTLRDYANAKVSPLYGIVEDGLQYRNQKDEIKYLSKKALGARLKRLKIPR